MKHLPDRWVLFSLIGLSVFSLFTMFGVKRDVFVSQLLFFLFGFVALIAGYRLNARFFKINGRIVYIVFLILLVLTYFFGSTVRGSKRWIDLFFFQFQTSEFFKPFFLIVLASFFSQKEKPTLYRFLISFFLYLIPTIIIFKQPDFATAVVYTISYLGLLFFSGFPLRYFFYTVGAFIVSFPVFWHVLKDYQKDRFISFINPQLYSQDIAYNLIQAIVTTGSGGIWGRGLGLGTQTRYRFLPEHHTDFAFASLVEQFGLIGGFLVLLFFSIFLYRLMKKAFARRNVPFEFLFLTGTILMIASSLFINIGMNVGILPVAGITLPLISYGGSSIVSTLLLIGLALSI